eukprot:Hpha_TRINITY_DN31520_c0_g1::TRINITY_DN31520_c0_g1_i1::g.1647::m.1647
MRVQRRDLHGCPACNTSTDRPTDNGTLNSTLLTSNTRSQKEPYSPSLCQPAPSALSSSDSLSFSIPVTVAPFRIPLGGAVHSTPLRRPHPRALLAPAASTLHPPFG